VLHTWNSCNICSLGQLPDYLPSRTSWVWSCLNKHILSNLSPAMYIKRHLFFSHILFSSKLTTGRTCLQRSLRTSKFPNSHYAFQYSSSSKNKQFKKFVSSWTFFAHTSDDQGDVVWASAAITRPLSTFSSLSFSADLSPETVKIRTMEVGFGNRMLFEVLVHYVCLVWLEFV
jgi:hypothetical protein